jgi:hypothetical protein
VQWYSLSAMLYWGCGISPEERQTLQGVTKLIVSRTGLESRAAEGNSPVRENNQPPERHPSSAGSGKARVNLRGPPRKAKHKLATDSARVP